VFYEFENQDVLFLASRLERSPAFDLGCQNSHKFFAHFFFEIIKFYQAVAPIIYNPEHCFDCFSNSIEGTVCLL
jgi:hypothetical protein